MGAGDEGNTPTKSTKSTSSTKEVPTTPMYPDWSSSMQAYYGGAAPPFFAPTVASPTPHAYMWGGQHPMMPSYGTPVPYPGLYPPGGVYAHPHMAMDPGMVNNNIINNNNNNNNTELEGKSIEGTSSKKAKGSSGNHSLIISKSGDDNRIVASGSGNDVGTQSADSETEGSSNASDENYNNQEFSAAKKGSFDQMLADAANVQNNAMISMHPNMDLWNSSHHNGSNLRPNPSGVSPTIAPSGMMNDQRIRDERELKKEKRKLSNRESARRSRLRKQAECEELQERVDSLSNENHSLRNELQRLAEECEKLTAENDSIKEELTTLGGPDAASKLENNKSTTFLESREDEGNKKN